MFDKIVNEIKNNKRVIYLAPTRELIEFVRGEILKRAGCLYNVDVITFDDLSRRISKNHLGSSELITYEASLVLVEEILKELGEEKIKYFSKVYDKKGFAVNALNAIRIIKREYVNIDEFKEIINSIGDEVLKRKTEDLITIYKAYQEKLASLNLMDMDDIIKIAVENVDKTTYFENVSLFIIDGYIDIFKSEKKLLETIKNNFAEIEFIYHLPLNVPYVYDFAGREALGFAKELKFEINNDDFLNTKYRYLAEALFTDRELDDNVDVKILDAPCIEDEVRQVASNIKEIYKEKGIELDKIALIVPDREEYEDTLLEIFNEYGIHISLSDTELLSKIPFIKTIMALLRLKNERYNKNLLQDIASSPYLLISERYDVLKVLERYFNGKDTVTFLEKLPDEFKVKNEDEEVQREYTEKISKLRENYAKFDDIINKKLSKLKNKASFQEYKKAVVDILDEFGIKKSIVYLYKKEKISQEIMLRDLKSLFGFIEMLNNLGEVYKYQTSQIDYTEFLDILDENITATTVTLSPKKSYGVKVLTPDLIRGTSYDYVFIMGLNEGKFPKISKAAGIYTTREKEIIYRQGVNFGSSIFEMDKEKIRFILSIASSKEGLFLSYRTSGEDGSYISKSQFLDEVIYKLGLHKNFEERKVRTMRDRFSLNRIYSREELVKRYCITKDSRIKYDELNYLDLAIEVEEKRNDDKFTEYDGLVDIDKMKDSNRRDVFSASKIMSYNKCPFRYFIEDVLNIRKWEDDVYSNLNFGNIYHYVLENYYKDCIGKELEYKENKIEELIKEAFKNFGLVLEDNYTDITREQLLENIKGFIDVDVKYKNEIKFRPYLIEKEFELDNLIEGIKIKGRIDRVDMEYNGDKPTGRYIIQDYKISLPNQFSIKNMLQGELIQVVLYYYVVNSILEEELEIKPECVGLVYYDINTTVEKNSKKISGVIVAKDKEELKILKTHHQTTTVAKENFDVVITHITQNYIEDSIEKIKRAVFTLPKICEVQSAFNLSCDYEDVCRYNKLRLLNKCEVKI